MLNFVSKLIGGSKSDKDIKQIQPIVDEINKIYSGLSSLSDEEIKAKTQEYKDAIKEHVKELEDEKEELQRKLQDEALSPKETQDSHDRIKKLDDEIFDAIQEKLDELLPEAYAVVKDVCRRLTEKKHSYTYANNTSVWAMIPYDVQLIGAIVLHQGKIAEMATGEGKTLVSIMPLYLNSLAGKGVHLVTVNDYLAKRDCEWMKPVFEFLGVETGSLQPKMDNRDRKKYYNMDITYGTNNEFGFDYLRDNMARELDHQVQRGHWYAIVDEIDSVLIDEGKTPLIISGPVGRQSENQKFDEMNSRVKKLVQAQNKLINETLADVPKLLESNKKEDRKEAGIKLLRAYRGLPKHKRLLKILQDPEAAKLLKETELDHLKDQMKAMKELDETVYYTIEEKNFSTDISEMGRELLTSAQEDPEMFLIPDIADEMSQIEGDKEITETEKNAKIAKLNAVYAEKSDRLHTTHQLLKAYSLYERDVEYVVQDGKVQIVDENTGRILDGRRYSDGLHQAIEAKEGVKVEKDTQTFATITLQNYYRMYNKLSGMTGTAETEAAEFEKIYKLEVVVIPTNRPIVRDDQNDVLYKTKREKYNALVDEVEELLKQGRPVLVGTSTVDVSEILSKMFSRRKIKHNLLNAKQHQKEAEIVSNAGYPGTLTIATNMAGRGTDIKLSQEVINNGGLAIIGSERHDSRRIDRQLRGRAGRQGDPGSSKFYISMEDNLMRLFGGEKSAQWMTRLKIPEGEPIEANMMTKAVERAQKKVEENNFSIRKRLLEYDDVMNNQRDVIYTRRKHALSGERLKGEIFDYLEDVASDWYYTYVEGENSDIDGLRNQTRKTILTNPTESNDEIKSMSEDQLVQMVLKYAEEFYSRKEEILGSNFMKILEREAFLRSVDDHWREHLRTMDDLKEGIHLRSYAQKDPLVEYKREAFELFVDLIKDINKDSVQFAFTFFPQGIENQVQADETGLPQFKNTTSTANLSYEHSDTAPSYARAPQGGQGGVPQGEQPQGKDASTVKTIRREQPKIGRNDTVRVRFANGEEKEVKYKKVEKEISNGTAELIDVV